MNEAERTNPRPRWWSVPPARDLGPSGAARVAAVPAQGEPPPPAAPEVSALTEFAGPTEKPTSQHDRDQGLWAAPVTGAARSRGGEGASGAGEHDPWAAPPPQLQLPDSVQWSGAVPGGSRYDPWAAPWQMGDAAPQPPARRRGGLLVGGVLLALVASALGGAVGAYAERTGAFAGTVELSQPEVERQTREPGSVAGIAASALPGVVTLHVRGGGASGTGTGFVLDHQGHILTNNHVVSPASSASGRISVTFSGGEVAAAEIVGRDSGYDLAVVRVRGVKGLRPLPLGNSDNVRVGDPVVAIGAPFDLSNTVTAGIISAKERPITAGGDKGASDVSYVDALQTDAPINPGNSGGPLVDSLARVIGINSAIRAADEDQGLKEGQGGSIGLGFAIPINQGKRVAEELINTGRATHPVIGVTLDMQYAGDGARVAVEEREGRPPVDPDGPGSRAGIRPGDVITSVDGRRVHGGEELIIKIRAHRPGDRLKLGLIRDGRSRTVSVVLGSATGS
ncbi:S1C family serine protease [Streptomyces sp. NPDC006879]|uniref:S1C family serine protease n=1 Tax=Streptomyces sp. NPDC006879 TaxID=3364767 RepID=UPI0036C25ABC